MKRPLLAAASLIALSLQAAPAMAELSVCDRNLRITETDIAFPGGLEPSLERVYRSDSRDSGLFGRGWSSRYETRVEKQADGSLMTHESGCTATTLFVPVPGNAGRWEARGCGVQSITANPSGFERHMADGRSERFDTDGRLLRVADTNGNWVSLHREQGRVVRIEDNFGRVMTLSYDADGRIVRIGDDVGREARYRFDGEGRMIAAIDPDGGEHRYTYGEDGVLTAVEAPGGGKVTARYEAGNLARLDENGGVRRFGRRDGEGWTESWEETEDAGRHGLILDRIIRLYRADSSGQSVRWRELRERDGRTQDTEYNDLGLVATIREDNGLGAGFRYDRAGRLVHKETPAEAIDIAYDPQTGKVARIDRMADGRHSWSRFTYDAQGNLNGAANSEGRMVSLGHDPQGRIAWITEKGTQLSFTYNRDSQPTRIRLKGGGTIDVVYDGKGEINSVQSDGGAAMALKVTRTFQNLLELVKPANLKIAP
ncbi:MAG: RHS repeat protein [Alphaproteobacteria bacterium]|nr:RHS repeat protein [Alphaproteobacteria bacterium]